MAKIKAASTLRPPLDCCPTLDYWLRYYPCPATGSGHRLVHSWVMSAANACRHFELTTEQAAEWIVPRMSRDPERREIEDTLEKVYGSESGTFAGSKGEPKPKHNPFDAEKLRERIAGVDIPDPIQFLRDQSPIRTDIRPSEFLQAITPPGHCRAVLNDPNSFGTQVKIWRRGENLEQIEIDKRIDELAKTSPLGAWFLNAPVCGQMIDGSLRTIQCVTRWELALLECDCDELGVDQADWLRLLLTLPLAIVSIVHSGKRGAHALVRGPVTTSKEEFEEWMDRELLPLTVYGTDHNSLRAHKLTRLANVYRAKERQWQSLYYLNPSADGTPICSATFGANSASQNRAEKATNINEGEEKERAWRTYLAYNVKAKKDGRKSVEYSENSLQKAHKMGERTAETWQKFLPLKANLLDLLKAWKEDGLRLRKTWGEQTEQTIRGWQQKAARIVEWIREQVEGERRAFPVDALPPVFRDLAVSIAKTHKSEDKIGVIALPMIGVLSGSLGQGIRVQTARFISYPNIFVYMSVGSGGIKSVAMEEAWAPAKTFQTIQLEDYENDVKPDTLADLREIDEKIKNWLEGARDIGENESDGGLGRLYQEKAMLEKLLEFCPVKLDDATPESVVMHGINHGRVFVCTDEASVVTDIIAGRYSKGFTNDGPLCRMWSSSDLSRKRKDGYIYSPRVTGSMVLMGQEHITEKMFQDENMLSSGFIPRFLFASSETPMLKRNRSRLTVSDEARGNYANVITYVLENHWKKNTEQLATTIGMTDEAQDALDDYHDSYVDRGNTTLSDAKRSLHRIAEQATRIALIFHVAKVYGSKTGLDSDVTDINEPISMSTVQDAIKVVDWSLRNYLEYSQPAREDAMDELEAEVLSKAKTFSEPFTVRDIQRKARSKKLTGSAHIASILDGLVTKGQLAFSAGKYSIPTKKA